jgi:CRISPR system Cascade subunit CasB
MTTNTVTESRTSADLAKAVQFLKSVHRDIKNDNGAKATLKRAITGEPKHLRAVYPILLRYLGDTKYHVDQWIFGACLFASDSEQKLEREERSNFGKSVKGLAGNTDSEGPERRFKALLDTSLENLHIPLAALVRLMKTKGIAIDYPQLIVDLIRWDHPDQYIQDKWARTFWGAPPPTATEEIEATDEDE